MTKNAYAQAHITAAMEQVNTITAWLMQQQAVLSSGGMTWPLEGELRRLVAGLADVADRCAEGGEYAQTYPVTRKDGTVVRVSVPPSNNE